MGKHAPVSFCENSPSRTLVLIGAPNVGKSALFNALTGAYATVSNYPGTTVEVARGQMAIDGCAWEVIDTPGTYSLAPITEDERIARAIILSQKPDAVVHVMDAKNIERMLGFTLQLIEAGLPVLVVLNVMDEARQEGVEIKTSLLERELGVPVVETVATEGKGIDELKRTVQGYARKTSGPC
jgi:ferrous iron transport protein B